MTKSFKSASSIILILSILAVGYFGVYGFWNQLSEARAAKAVSEAENARLQKALADIQAFVNDYNSNLSQAQVAEKALPVGDPDVAELLDYYTKQVKDSGLALIDLSMQDSEPTPGITPGTLQSVDWDMQVSGSFEAFKDYLLRVRQGLRLTDVLSVNAALADAESAAGRTLRFSLKLRTYYQR